ncbi:hypothetical protein BGZ70_003603, partial [Mortierella alpina]
MTATTTTANASAPANNEGAVASHEVGMMFVHEYYTFLNKEPSRLHCFYNKQSTMSHGIQGEDPQDIHSKILDLDFEDCKVLVSNVDSQSSLNGGIMIQVLGEMSNRGGPSQKFVQTFFLAEQPRGYYVLNDIFRYLKEDADVEVETEVEAVEEEPSPEYTLEAEPVAAAIATDAAPEAAAAVVEEVAPVVAAAVEVPTPEAAEPVSEQKIEPKTWANLAANNSNQWGSHASAAKGSSVNVTPVATPKPQTPVPAQQQNNKPLDRKPTTTNNNNAREEMLFIY